MARKGPIVRHANKSEETRAGRKILKCFTDKMQKQLNDMITSGVLKKKDLCADDNAEITGVQLLAIRKKLASTIKNGMLERKNMEPEIAIYTAILWFMRLEKTRRDQILNEWGAY